MSRELPSHYRLRRLLLSLPGLSAIPKPGGLRSRLREKLLSVGWPSNPGFASQGGQDRYVDEFLLEGKRGGVFVEIGANDGETFSNCLFFEEQRSWTGVCVEPNPATFAQLGKRRPQARCLQLAVGPECCEIKFPVVSSGEESLYASRDKESDEGWTEIRQVDLPTLFTECRLEHVDLLSIDVEGGEEAILATLADSPLRPIVVCAEENTTPKEMDRIMAGLGYETVARVWPDRVYQLRG